ncbi:MAG TPA: polysaccharide biosynthesis tyrosine autokinase [Anaeromyxobacter sp.]
MAVPPTKLEEVHAHAPGYAHEPSQAEPGQDAIDLRAYWRTILRRRWIIIPFFVATVLVTALVTLRQTKIYDATCTLIIDLSAPKVLDSEQMKDVVESGTGGYWYSKEYYETQYKVITSRAVAQRVSDKLALSTNLRFLRIDGIQDSAERERKRLKKDPAEILLDNLKVQPVKDSRVVRLRYEDPDPALAALIANTWAEAYIAENLSVKSVTTQHASDWLEQQLADLERKLDQSGKALFEFKRSHDIVATSWEDRQSMVSQRLTATNDALTKARVRKAELEARNETIAALGAALEHGDAEAASLDAVAASSVIQQLKVRYAEAQTECADLRAKYFENHPKLEACDKKVASAKKALQDEIRTTFEAARLEYKQVEQSEKNLQALLNETKRDAFSLNQYERDYLELKRAYDNNQRLYELVLKRLKDTGVTGLLQVSNVRVLDRALPAEKPVRPNVWQNLLLALLLGVIGGVGLAFGAEYLDTSITTQDQIEEKLGLTFLGLIPSIPKNAEGSPQDLFVFRQPKSPVAECVRSVRTNLLFMSPEKPLKTILITSSGPQEGKTTTAASLAATMATSGNRTLLVDADMRRPRVHRIFGASNARGLSSLIVGEGALDDAVHSTEIPNLHVLACGPVPPNPAELLHTAVFKALLSEMERKFDRVIIDSPPVGIVADAVVMATSVDGTLMVLKAGQTSRDLARRAARQLADVNARVFGAVLNDLDLENQKYGQYYYYYRYGYYYGREKGIASADAGP